MVAEPLANDIRRAAATGEQHAIEAAVIAAIARQPGQTGQFVGLAASLAPALAPGMARTVARAYPAFADTIARAAGSPRLVTEPASKPIEVHAKKSETTLETDDPWSGELELGAGATTGNTEEANVNAAAAVNHERGNWSHALRARFDFTEDDGDTIKRRLLSSFETNYKLSDRAYVLGFIEYEDDRFSGFDYRLTQNLGLGYRLIDQETVQLSLEAGPGFRYTEFEDGDTESELIGRASGDLLWRLSDTAKFTDEASLVAGSQTTTLRNMAALTATLAGSLGVRVSFEIRHDTDVEPGRENTDTTTKAAFVYEL